MLTLCLLPLVASPRAACRAWRLALPAGPWRRRHDAEAPLWGEACGWPLLIAWLGSQQLAGAMEEPAREEAGP